MIRFTVQSIGFMLLSGCLTFGQAGSQAIGVVVARGSFEVDDARISGNATLFDGTTIQAGSVGSELRLNNGARLSLGAGARGRVYQDHLSLERGESQMSAKEGYMVRARTLRILPEGAGSNGLIRLAGDKKVQVIAMAGGVRVTNFDGVLVARLSAGMAMDFEPQAAGAAAPSRLTGCLQKTGSRYLLTDEATSVTVELEGPQLQAQAGNRIQIVGTLNPSARPADASHIIKVTGVTRMAKGCRAGKGAAAVGTGAAAAGAVTGSTSGATVAVVAGVAVAATVGGLAAAEKLPGQGDDAKPSASR